MALEWTWAFGPESALVLETSMGWDFVNTSAAANEPRTTFQYTYAGSPTRYSMALDQTVSFRVPVAVSPPTGWVAIAVYADASQFSSLYNLIEVRGAVGNRVVAIRMLVSGALSLYVDSTFQASTVIVQWLGQWNYVALRYDQSTATWSGQIWVNGVALTAVETDPAVFGAEIEAIATFFGTTAGDRNHYIAQIAVWDDLADPGEVARYITRLDVDADVSEVGTWTPLLPAVTNFAVVGGPFVSTTYTEEAVPSASDDVIVDLSTDLATKLGVTPTVIDGVTAHTYSTGLGQTARAEVGDQVGTTTTTGDTGAISSGTTDRHATAPVKPSGGAWTGTDTPKGKYFIVTV